MAVLGEKTTETLSMLKDPMIIEKVLSQLNLLEEIEKTNHYLQNEFSQRIMSSSEIAKKKEEMTQKELKAKEKAVLSVRKNKITSCQLISHGKMKTKYQTHCSGKRPRLDSYEALFEYLYTFYFGETII